MKDTAPLEIFKDFGGYCPTCLPVAKVSLFQEFIVRPDPRRPAIRGSCRPAADGEQGVQRPQMVRREGMFELMFLKAYLNVSDRHLIERFNADYILQMFCGKLAEDKYVRDTTIMARTSWKIR